MKKKCKSEVSLVPKKHPDSEQRVKHINSNLQKKSCDINTIMLNKINLLNMKLVK